MESSKNVLELMKEFYQEQENMNLKENSKLNGDKVDSVVENKQVEPLSYNKKNYIFPYFRLQIYLGLLGEQILK